MNISYKDHKPMKKFAEVQPLKNMMNSWPWVMGAWGGGAFGGGKAPQKVRHFYENWILTPHMPKKIYDPTPLLQEWFISNPLPP